MRITVVVPAVISVAGGLCLIGEARGQNLNGRGEGLGARVRDLHLTCTQEANIAGIREEYGEKVEDAATQLDALVKEEIKQVRAVLTPEQKVKLESMKEERREWRAGGVAERMAHLRDLHLTDAEMAKFAEIRKEYRPRVVKAMEGLKDILTPEQMQAREKALSAGQSHRQVIASLNLTSEQERKAEAVGKEVRGLVREELEQMRDVLSAEQRAQLPVLKEERRERIRDRLAAAVANFKELDLTDQQKGQIEAIRTEYRPKIHEAGNELRSVVRAELDAILNVLREGFAAREEVREKIASRGEEVRERIAARRDVREEVTPCGEVTEIVTACCGD